MSDKGESSVERAVLDYIRRAVGSPQVREAHLIGVGAVAELEERLRRLYRAEHALCVSNATIGLWAIAIALELENAEFVTTPYTYGATLSGWMRMGAEPVFADIDPLTLTLDPTAARRCITPRTKALLAADIYGNPSHMAALREVADECGLWYVADAAQSVGAKRNGLPASSLADAWVISFTSGKTVYAGEGGAILTNNRDLHERLIWYTQHPYRQRRELGLRMSNEFSMNARIHPLAAVWANAVFDESLEQLRERQAECGAVIAALNATGLAEGIDFAGRAIEPSFFRLTAAWKAKPREERLVSELRENGFEVALGSPPVTLVYRQASFLAQYARRFSAPFRCARAEEQVKKRFSVMQRSWPY
jgi:dTDP-4-amino-4,6-dideoxygalactose transaminase